MVTEFEPAPSAPAITLHRLLSRGYRNEAQVLLVLLSTDDAPTSSCDDYWVAIGRADPVEMSARRGLEGIEIARQLDLAELRRLDFECRPDKAPFGLVLEGRRFSVARFDFSDHPYVAECWNFVLAAPIASEPERGLEVVAWRSTSGSGGEGAPADSDRLTPTRDVAREQWKAADVVPQPLVDLGVLFVHGIGNHARRETLVRWADPIVEFWRRRALSLNSHARAEVPAEDRMRTRRWLFAKQLRNRRALEGISQITNDFPGSTNLERERADREPLQRPNAAKRQGCLAAVVAEDTPLGDDSTSQPAATLLRLSTVDSDATLREAHVLFAEAHWTDDVFLPTFSELYRWLTRDGPIVSVWARLHRLVISRPRELSADWLGAASATTRIRATSSLVYWFAQLFVLAPLHVASALAVQFLIGLLGGLGLVPIQWVRSFARRSMTALMGTVGQSCALTLSEVRRSAIVSAVVRNLDWLDQKCQRIVIVSHSQGAEITRQVLASRRVDHLTRWYTAGAGIAPLNMLDPSNRTTQAGKTMKSLWMSTLIVSALVLGWALLDCVPGVSLGLLDALVLSWRNDALSLLAILYVVMLALGLFVGRLPEPLCRPNLRRSVLGSWYDFYASADPVPGGSLFDRFGAEMRQLDLDAPHQRRLTNTRFALFDHTSYFSNVEQFVAPMAMDLARLAGLGSDATLEKEALERGSVRREWRTWWRKLAALALLGGGVWASVRIGWFGPEPRVDAWLQKANAIVASTSSVGQRLGEAWRDGFIGILLTDLWLPLSLIVAVLAIETIYRWLEQRSETQLLDDLAAVARRGPMVWPPKNGRHEIC